MRPKLQQPEFHSVPEDEKGSLVPVYLTLGPFLVLEYAVQRFSQTIPPGVVFPLGFLLFWAFFYSYYRPGSLENTLRERGEFGLLSILELGMGVFIWFVKVTLIDSLKWVFSFVHSQFKTSPKKSYQKQTSRASNSGPKPRPPSPYPREVREALEVLGFEDRTTWSAIQKRYRTLAKQYHPDLNPDITRVGRRFIRYDNAYRTLVGVKERYFIQ